VEYFSIYYKYNNYIGHMVFFFIIFNQNNYPLSCSNIFSSQITCLLKLDNSPLKKSSLPYYFLLLLFYFSFFAKHTEIICLWHTTLNTHSKQCWVVLTQFWVKYGQTQPMGYIFEW